jgi:hypothetical protein
MKHSLPATLVLGVLGACGASACATAPTPHAGGTSSADAGASDATDPFALQPDQSLGLTNVSSDLGALLENGALPGACAAYQEQADAGAVDTQAMLLCGKWMFLYGTFGTSGVPASLVQFLATNFPGQLGLGFSKLGLVPDPTSTTNMPLGLARASR